MTASCIRVSSDILIGKNEDKIFSYLSKNLYKTGVTLTNMSVILDLRDNIFNTINATNSDCIIIVGDGNPKSHFNIKNAVCDYFNLQIVRDDNLAQILASHNIDFKSLDIKNEIFLPEGASILINPYSYQQGWFLEGSKTIIYLPSQLIEVEYIFNNTLIPYFSKVQNSFTDTKNILLFGINENDALNTLKDIIPSDVSFTFYEEDMLLKLLLRYPSNIDKYLLNDVVSNIYQRLRKFIITDDDTTLYQLSLDLLTISNKSLCIYETVTAGNIALNLSKSSSVAKHLIQSARVGFTQNNITRELNIPQNLITKYGFYSVNMAYEIAGILLDETRSDLVLLTLGNLNEDNTCFIAVGDNDGIHIYKSSVNQKDRAIEILSNSAIYYLIKKLKQNDLYFNKIIV